MRVDLTNTFNEGVQRLNMWRGRYSKAEYPSKLVMNIFYRQYAMGDIWNTTIEPSFGKLKGTEKDVLSAFQKLQMEYSQNSQKFTIGNTLIDLMNKKQDIGGLNYANNIPLINQAQKGDNAALEELEFTYLYKFLSNEAVLMWAAFGRCGYNKIDAIAQVTGAVIADQPLDYSTILQILGQIGISRTMDNLYEPLPNLF